MNKEFSYSYLRKWYNQPCHTSGGYSPAFHRSDPGSIPGSSICELIHKLYSQYFDFRGWNSTVNMAARLRAGRPDFRTPVGARDFLFSFHTLPDRHWGPRGLLYNRYRGPLPEVKRPGRGVDHPLASKPEIMTEQGCTVTPPMCLHVM
jgi:hypothetical protein